MKYFIPSKTFLTGEYSVLVGGAALGLATTPSFEISYLQQETTLQFHENSPAGRFLKNRNSKLRVHLLDPYLAKGVRGGFGKSTAEYFAVVLPDLLNQKIKPSEIRSQYLSFFGNEKIKPSGVDLMFQYLGHVGYVNPADEEFQTLKWNFSDLNFFVIATGLKIKTHEHLEKLNLMDLKELPNYSNQVIDAYFNKSSNLFLRALKSWVQILQQRNLTAPAAREIREDLEKIPHVRLVKPCGALGADVMLVFFDAVQKESVLSELRKKKIKVQASREDLTEGLVKYVG